MKPMASYIAAQMFVRLKGNAVSRSQD